MIESNNSCLHPKHCQDDDFFGGQDRWQGSVQQKRIMELIIYIYIAIATGILVFSFSHSLSHLDGFFRIFLGFCCNSKREVLDHEVYLQGAPFGRDLIHWDRQFFDGFLVRLLTVLAAWVWGPRGHMDPRVGDVVMCGLSFGMFWACLGFRIFRAVSNPGYSKHRLAPKFR